MSELTRELERIKAVADSSNVTMRLHLWLELEDAMFFGMGRVQLLAYIEEQGSLKKAADRLGMSYRAAWGKIKKTEDVLGAKLIVRSANKRGGYQLTDLGRYLKNRYTLWFDAVEKEALRMAVEAFPWHVRLYEESS